MPIATSGKIIKCSCFENAELKNAFQIIKTVVSCLFVFNLGGVVSFTCTIPFNILFYQPTFGVVELFNTKNITPKTKRQFLILKQFHRLVLKLVDVNIEYNVVFSDII